jgi:crotonobetainyl-CoA:carnitine CoA-transferase CaiB-like acyl-CoA transferase
MRKRKQPHSDPVAPLEGVRVLLLAQQFPGPFMGTVLADLGADVIVIEHPDHGDPTRRLPSCFEALNRNRRGIVLDLKTRAGKEALLRLVASADALVEGFRPGVLARLGLAPATLQGGNPDLVVVSISAYGQSGPDSAAPGHDLVVQARSGLVRDATAWSAGQLPLADLSAAMYAVIALLAGLVARRPGTTAPVADVAMLDTLVSWQTLHLVSEVNGWPAVPYPPQDPGYGVFELGDGVLLALGIAGEDEQWRRLCGVLGLADFAEFDAVRRERSRAKIIPRLQSALRGVDVTVCATLIKAGISAAPVTTLAKVAADPQVVARQLIVPVHERSDVRAVRQPIRFAGGTPPLRRMAPRLGEHTRDVLAEVGCPDELIDEVLARAAEGQQHGHELEAQ